MNLAGKQQVRRLFAKQAVLRSRELGSRGITRVEGVTIRVYSAANTVADCFKYRSKVGSDIGPGRHDKHHVVPGAPGQ